jgi:rSAM/selenodomain-associated transferase 2
MARMAVVIPTLDEEANLAATLAELQADPPLPLEVVVSDGGSRDHTVAIARASGARVVEGPPGRARQMNLGAAATAGDPVLFLHADCRLGRAHLAAITAALADPAVSFGSFPIRIAPGGALLGLIAAAANLRTRLDRTPYGDQAIFTRRRAFTTVGGYPEVPILEDLLLGRRLRDTGRYAFLPGPPVTVSPRRWQRGGIARTTLCNATTRLLFELGASPGWLRGFYDAGGVKPRAAAARLGEK